MKNKDKQNKSIEDLTYDILGNAFEVTYLIYQMI